MTTSRRQVNALDILAADGQPIGGNILPAIGAERGVAIVLHAMMVDRRAFRGNAGLPGVLQQAGYTCWLADFRGRGRSPCATFRYDDLVSHDVPALLRAARSATSGPVVVVGHSLGAHVSLAAACHGDRADAYVLLAGNVWMPRLDRNPVRRLARSVTMRLFSAASRGGRFPARSVRMGPVNEPRDYVSDIVRFWRTDRWCSRAGFDWWDAAARLDVPVLALTGAGDRLMAHPTGARAFAERVHGARFEVVGRASGLSADVGHMGIVTDEAARPAWERVARWLVTA